MKYTQCIVTWLYLHNVNIRLHVQTYWHPKIPNILTCNAAHRGVMRTYDTWKCSPGPMYWDWLLEHVLSCHTWRCFARAGQEDTSSCELTKTNVMVVNSHGPNVADQWWFVFDRPSRFCQNELGMVHENIRTVQVWYSVKAKLKRISTNLIRKSNT